MQKKNQAVRRIPLAPPSCHKTPEDWGTKEDGTLFSEEELKELIPQWKKRDFHCDYKHKLTGQMAFDYSIYECNRPRLYKHIRENVKIPKEKMYCIFERAGLLEMFNRGFVKSPAFVDWQSVSSLSLEGQCGLPNVFIEDRLCFIEDFINCIASLQMRIDILTYLKKIYKSLSQNKVTEAKINALLIDAEEALKIEKSQSTNQKPLSDSDYTLSLEEIVQYANTEGKAHAEALRAMLRYFKEEKDGFDTATVKKFIHAIQLPDTKTFNIQHANQVVGNMEKQDIHHE